MGLGIIIGMVIGAVAWHAGLVVMVEIQKRGGVYRRCENCGATIFPPITKTLSCRKIRRGGA